MQAQVNLKINPMQLPRIQEGAKREEAEKKSKSPLARFQKFISKSVNYYADEEFQKNGSPLRWID